MRLRIEVPRSKARIQELTGIARPDDMARLTEALLCYLND
jgi:hypothetical protein